MTLSIAAAPISWGVCEDPAWPELPDPDTVLAQMHELGYVATELGPDGWLGESPSKLLDTAERHELQLVGGFLGERLHARDHAATIRALAERLDYLEAANAPVFVLAASADSEGSYQAGAVGLDRDDFNRIEKVFHRLVDELEARPALTIALHPHVGTAIETRDQVLRTVERMVKVGHPRIGLCLDTGHLVLGGMDPAELVEEVPELIVHVHLKDIGDIAASRVRDGGMPYIEAVRNGLYTPLGHGDVELETVVNPLVKHGYAGWWVLEQDRFPSTDPMRASEEAAESMTVARELLELAEAELVRDA